MEYIGKLYGKINGKYVEMTETVEDLERKVEQNLERINKYGRHQHFIGSQGKEVVKFEDWKQD